MHNQTLVQNIIKSILNVRCREGATIADIQNDYQEIEGESLLDIYNWLTSIDGVYYLDRCGESRWYLKSDKVQHVTKLILDQKPLQTKPIWVQTQKQPINKNCNGKNNVNDCNVKNTTSGNIGCFFQDNIVYKNMRKNKQFSLKFQNELRNNNSRSYIDNFILKSPKRPPPLHAQLMGDDIFHQLVTRDPKNGDVQNGLSIPGLSISDAIRIIKRTNRFKSSKMIINVGSVDILDGCDLNEMCSNFKILIRLCELRGLTPVITTLVPFTNQSHSAAMRDKLIAFNIFLEDTYFSKHPMIDFWSKMVNPSGHTDLSNFDTFSVHMNGCRTHVLLNRKGCTLIRRHIEWNLSHILNVGVNECINYDA